MASFRDIFNGILGWLRPSPVLQPPFVIRITTNRQGIIRTTTEYSFCITTDRYRVVRTSGR